MKNLPNTDRFQSFIMGLFLSGAIGNAIDRIHKQTVTDFLRIYTDSPTLKPWLQDVVGMSEWPTFNIADIALVLGVILYGYYSIFIEPKQNATQE